MESESKKYANLEAKELLRLLEIPIDDRRPMINRIKREVKINTLVEALGESDNDLTSVILCYILGGRKSKRAIPVLLRCLENPDPSVIDAAAIALGKIGDISAGPKLLEFFRKDPFVWVAVALGAIHYRDSIPDLISILTDSNSKMKGCAAWSLGEMKASEALEPLRHALENEVDDYAVERISEAIRLIELGH